MSNSDGVNLALMPGVRISVSVDHPTGGGNHNPEILLNNSAHLLDDGMIDQFTQGRTFDTFQGRKQHNDLDWYELNFPKIVEINCIEMTTGLPYRDGGWWTSLNVEYRTTKESAWQSVRNLSLYPAYNFADSRKDRRPFESYSLVFEDIAVEAIRLIGVPGGLVGFTSLARLAAFHYDLSRWDPQQLNHIPIPHIYRLISPANIWDLSSGLTRLTGLGASFPILEYYLDQDRLDRDWVREGPYYSGKPYLDMLVGDAVGWDLWVSLRDVRQHSFNTSIQPAPYVELCFNETLCSAVAPVHVDGVLMGRLSSSQAMVSGDVDWTWHRHFANQYHIAWDDYMAALERTPRMTLEQMEGVAEILGVIANSIAQMAQRNLVLEEEVKRVRATSSSGRVDQKELIHRAVEFMKDNLEEDIHMADVARSINLSPSYFSTIFVNQMGFSPTDLFQRLRIERAKEYLRHTELTVMDVCVALNFNPSYFNRLFKKMVGITPGEFARKERLLS